MRQAREAQTKETPSSSLPFGDWIPSVTPGYSNPRHLGPLLAVFERIRRGEAVRVVLDAPPRHGKTETLMQGVAWLMEANPRLRAGFFTYSETLSESKSRFALQTARNVGIKLAREASEMWETAAGGSLLCGGVGGVFTGYGVDLLLMDDLFKNRQEAESALIRERRWEWYTDTARTRLESGGSIICSGTRWHEDDVQGRLLKMGYEHIHLPAISEAGRALWPERYDLAALEEIRAEVLEYTFSSLYQGEPRPRGAKVFKDAWYYETLPKSFRAAIGIDLAYSEDKKSDHSVALVMLLGKDGLIYLADRKKGQQEAPQFKQTSRALRSRYPGATARWYYAGPEKGIADFFKAAPDPFRMNALPATKDKLVRATPAASAWNRGDILCPAEAPWVPDFLRVVNGFTGSGDKEDDDVDALAAGFDELMDPQNEPLRLPDAGDGRTFRRV